MAPPSFLSGIILERSSLPVGYAVRLSCPREAPAPLWPQPYRGPDNGTICKHLSVRCGLSVLNTKGKVVSKNVLLILGHNYGRYSEYGLQK